MSVDVVGAHTCELPVDPQSAAARGMDLSWKGALRRAVIALLLFAIGVAVFRDVYAFAATQRAEDFISGNNLRAAVVYIRRAFWFDRDFSYAAQRYGDAMLRAQTPTALRNGEKVTTRVLSAHPDDYELRTVRAMLRTKQREFAPALEDWKTVAAAAGKPRWDSRSYLFAAETARRVGDLATTRHYLELALTLDPTDKVTREELARLPR